MIKLEINSEVRTFSPEKNSSIKSLLNTIKDQYHLTNQENLMINLNGHSINHAFSTATLSRPLVNGDYIQVVLEKNPYEEVIKSMEILISGIIKKIELKNFEKIRETRNLEKIISSLGALIKTSAFISRKMSNKDSQKTNTVLRNLKIHLLSVMKGIESAHKAQDDFMLEDLLEFELKDNLTKWKILIIPAIKEKLLKTT